MYTTRTTYGPWLYFQRAYGIHTLATILRRLHLPFSHMLRQHLESHYNIEAIITNRLGTFSINAKNDSLTKSISTFEYHHQNWLACPSQKRLFIDIGANIGFYSLLAVKCYGYQSAHTFEPNPNTFDRLSKNIKLNKLEDTIHIHQTALSNQVGTTHFSAHPTHTGASSLAKKATSNTLTVPTITFDQFILTQKICPSDISFIKIDVEGFELGVLEGMKDTLSKLQFGTCIFIESHSSHPDTQTVHTIITDLGFNLLDKTDQHNYLYKK